jgi:arsenate reductase
MATVTLYHNPSCSKSRQALAELNESQHQVRVVCYKKEPIDEATWRQIIPRLQDPQHHLVRCAKEFGIDATSNTETIIKALCAHPEHMQRPLVVTQQTAFIAR